MTYLLNTAQRVIAVHDLHKELDCDLMSRRFNELSFRQNINNMVSNDMNFFDADYLKTHKKFIETSCKSYLANTIISPDMFDQLYITLSWANKTEQNQSHHEHIHPFSVVSGIIFLEDNEDNFKLNIEGYLPDIPYFTPKNKTWVNIRQLCKNAGIDVTTHLKHHMILFLSNTYHFVEQVKSDKPRKTVSFNTFWKGHVGIPNNPLGSYYFRNT